MQFTSVALDVSPLHLGMWRMAVGGLWVWSWVAMFRCGGAVGIVIGCGGGRSVVGDVFSL